MKHKQSAKVGMAVPATLIKIGIEVIPIYGSRQQGFSMDPDDISRKPNRPYRYNTLDELLFALINLNIAPEGRA